jgi:hypothetical protein
MGCGKLKKHHTDLDTGDIASKQVQASCITFTAGSNKHQGTVAEHTKHWINQSVVHEQPAKPGQEVGCFLYGLETKEALCDQHSVFEDAWDPHSYPECEIVFHATGNDDDSHCDLDTLFKNVWDYELYPEWEMTFHKMDDEDNSHSCAGNPIGVMDVHRSTTDCAPKHQAPTCKDNVQAVFHHHHYQQQLCQQQLPVGLSIYGNVQCKLSMTVWKGRSQPTEKSKEIVVDSSFHSCTVPGVTIESSTHSPGGVANEPNVPLPPPEPPPDQTRAPVDGADKVHKFKHKRADRSIVQQLFGVPPKLLLLCLIVLLRFSFWEKVYYKAIEPGFPSDSTKEIGYVVGISNHVGHALCYKVYNPHTKKVLHCSHCMASLLDDPH